MDAETGASILAEAESWINTPYHHNARIKKVGIDCGHLLHAVYGVFYDLPPMPAEYAADWTLHQGQELYLEWMRPFTKEVTSPLPARPVVFKVGRCYGHGGIVTNRNTVIHAWGRTEFGAVQESSWGMFKKYPRKYFEVVI